MSQVKDPISEIESAIETIRESAKSLNAKENVKKFETVYVNFVGGPCSGKSTISAALFAAIKLKQEYSCELVTEAVKDFVYSSNTEALNDQLLITATQNHLLRKLKGKVQVVVTDAALFNGIIYNKFYGADPSTIDTLALECFHNYNNYVVLLPRKPKYDTYGRSQSEEEAKQIDKLFIEFLTKENVPFLDLRGLKHEEITEKVMELIPQIVPDTAK